MNKLNVARVCAAMFVVFAVCLTAYAEDGYIESEGDAYVSLGHCAGPNTKMEVDFQLTEIELQTKPFGSWGDRLSIPMFSLYINSRCGRKGERQRREGSGRFRRHAAGYDGEAQPPEHVDLHCRRRSEL